MHFFYGDIMNNRDKIEKILDVLLEKMIDSFENGEVPVAAVIVDRDCNILSLSGNNRQSSYNVLGHAEILAIQSAEKLIEDWRLNGYSMYVSLKPCEMCRVVIKECRLDRVFYLCERNSCEQIDESLFVKLDGFDDYGLKAANLLTSFFDNMR